MSLSITNYPDTPTAPVTGDRSLSAAKINYNADWRMVTEAPGEAVFTNIVAPVDQPEKLRIAVSDIANVFKGTDVPEPVALGSLTSKAGKSILLQSTGVGINSVDALSRVPYSAHLVLKVPTGVDLAISDILVMLERLLGHLYETGDTSTTSRLGSILRGALVPVDL